jgi:hypothetical protein
LHEGEEKGREDYSIWNVKGRTRAASLECPEQLTLMSGWLLADVVAIATRHYVEEAERAHGREISVELVRSCPAVGWHRVAYSLILLQTPPAGSELPELQGAARSSCCPAAVHEFGRRLAFG